MVVRLMAVPVRPRRITEGVRVMGDHPHMIEGEESSWVHVEENKRWYYNTETDAIELREE